MRLLPFIAVLGINAGLIAAGLTGRPTLLAWLALFAPLAALGVFDLVQRRHAIRRIYPLIGHLRWAFEAVRPELRQYFVEGDTDGLPFNHDQRTLVYERAKDAHGEAAFGTELDPEAPGYEWLTHSLAPRPESTTPLRVTIGGESGGLPYSMSLFNVSAMSFGSLSPNAVLALNAGAKMGGFAHDTGEGGLTRYHLEPGGDLIWEVGTAYFGCRTLAGAFDEPSFREKARHPQVKAISIKLSQGAKPGLGGVMPAAKVTPEIAAIRGVPVGVKCVSPPYHTAFTTPRGLLEFVARLRAASGGKPTGFKLCIGRRSEFLAICKAMLATKILPDFIVIDGGEGGTGAAPLEFEDHVGAPLSDGLIFVHNALVGSGLRDRIKVGCSGKVLSAFDIARRLAMGADYCNAARAMMFALGCIQAMRCQTNSCPTGVASQDPTRYRGLVVADKAERVFNYHANTLASLRQLVAAMGLTHPGELKPWMLCRRVGHGQALAYDRLYEFLEPGALLGAVVPSSWADDWRRATPETFS